MEKFKRPSTLSSKHSSETTTHAEQDWLSRAPEKKRPKPKPTQPPLPGMPPPEPPGTVRVLPMQLQIGDRSVDAIKAWVTEPPFSARPPSHPSSPFCPPGTGALRPTAYEA